MGLSLTGCESNSEIRQYVVEAENERGLTSELLRRQFPTIPFRWDVPSAWQLASNDQFSVRAWSAGSPPNPARITLGQFPARTGIPAQVMRWRRQVGLSSDNPDEAMNNVEALKTKNGAGSFATVEGAKETILALILPVKDQFWILRFKGTNSAARAEGSRFRTFCESLEYLAPPDAPRPRSATPETTPESSGATESPSPDSSTAEPATAGDESTELTESKTDEAAAPADSSDKGE